MSEQTWRDRLMEAIEADPRSDRALSRAAGLGPNFISQLRTRRSSPSLDHASKLCAAMNVSLVYIMTGMVMDEAGERFVRAAAHLSEEQRQRLLDLLLTMSPPPSDA